MDALKRLAAAALLVWAGAVLAQTDSRGAEAQIKAAFLFKFGGFVEWPPAAFARQDSPFVIGVAGAEAIAAELERMVAGRTVQGRPVLVQRLRRGESLAGLHMLFVGQPEAARLADMLSPARDQPLLVVTDWEGALSRGGTINFVTVEGKVRFDVALPQGERRQLKISSRLLSVARRVFSG
jgi:hypothetical protein